MAKDLPPPEEHQKDELTKIFEEGERSYLRRLVDMCKGFRAPKDSVERKKAMIEFQRLGAPILALLVISLSITALCLMKIGGDTKPPVVETQIVEPEQTEELEEPEEPPPPEEMQEMEEVTEVTDIEIDIEQPPTTSSEQSPSPSPVDAVSLSQSPIVLKGVHGSRNSGLRGAALGKYGASRTEALVMGNLRYLKTLQEPSGMWNNNTGDTAIVLLCFLAHGEIPGKSAEFGDTVKKAILALIDDQIKTEEEAKKDHGDAPRSGGHHAWRRGEIGYFKKRDQCNYAHLVATYALAEAYAMTRIPDLKQVVERAITPIVNGQNVNGGWYYNMDASCKVTDSSYTSWAVQALKAAKLAGFHDKKLVEALKKAAKGMMTCAHTTGNHAGAFGYLDKMPEKNTYFGLTATGALVLQMLDQGDSPFGKKAVAYMDKWKPTFKRDAYPGMGKSPQYYCYYLSQVRFNLGEGVDAWKRWNREQQRLYVAAAIEIPKDKSGYVDANGKPQPFYFWGHHNNKTKFKGESAPVADIDRLKAKAKGSSGTIDGFKVEDLICTDAATVDWENHGKNFIRSNCLTMLQLMVYYRNSPLAKGALTSIEEEVEQSISDGATEVQIEGMDDL